MNFNELLKRQKNRLNRTETKVTNLNGEVTIISKDNTVTKVISKSLYGFVIDTKPDLIPALIIENLYIGSQDCSLISVLQTYDISNVVSLGVEPLEKHPNCNYFFNEFYDLPETDIQAIFQKVYPLISKCLKNKSNILVHCNAGVSRAPTIVIAYLIVHCKMSFKNAFEIVKIARPCIRPNDGFLKQLLLLQT